MSVAGSLAYGFFNLLHPRMLWLMLWPMLVSAGFWGLLALVLWGRIARRLAALMRQWLESLGFLTAFNLADATLIAAHVALFLLFVPLVYLTVLVILGVFGMPKMVEHVAARAFPALERRRGGSIAGSVWNVFVAFFGLVLIGALSLPLWLVPPLWPVIAVTLLGWVNQRLLRYDALAEHAEAAEMSRLFRERRVPLYVLGLLLALAAYVPVVGLFAPVVFSLAFIHYLLGGLASSRHPK